MNKTSMEIYEEFLNVIREIREKCPWDSVQTHESLKNCFRNEAEEVLKGIDTFLSSGDSTNLCEELGDLLMLIVLESRIAGEEGLFTLDDVISGISAKMKYRHPKIFSPEDQEAAQLSWDELKKREKELRKSSGKPSVRM